MWRADDSELDRTIDACASQMTAGDPGASFRARVMERLDAARRDRHATAWSWPRIAAPVALAAALVIAIVIGRSWIPSVVESRFASVVVSTFRWATGVREPATTTAKTSEPAAPETPQTIAQASEQPTVATRKSPRGRERPPVAALPESDVEKLAPPPLSVASILVPEIGAAPSIELPQLEPITPITVAPLGEPQGDRP